MESDRRDANILIGKRLREARISMNKDKAEFAAAFDVTVEHYRKLEAGTTGLSADKILILYRTYGIDPTYLVTGSSRTEEFNLDSYVANCSKEQRDEFFDRVLEYLSRLIR